LRRKKFIYILRTSREITTTLPDQMHSPQADASKTVDKSKALEATVSYAQSLTQWALLIVAGTAVILIGSEYHRPSSRPLLFTYFLFIPGWISLILSMYKGARVQQVYLAYLWTAKPDWTKSMSSVNTDALWQIRGMQTGVAVFGVWLLVYLFYWVLFYHLPSEVH
jgi:hypothetical protein